MGSPRGLIVTYQDVRHEFPVPRVDRNLCGITGNFCREPGIRSEGHGCLVGGVWCETRGIGVKLVGARREIRRCACSVKVSQHRLIPIYCQGSFLLTPDRHRQCVTGTRSLFSSANRNRLLPISTSVARPNFRPGRRPGIVSAMNESPERAGQSTPQPRIVIETPFQGFVEWGRVSQGVALGSSWNASSSLLTWFSKSDRLLARGTLGLAWA